MKFLLAMLLGCGLVFGLGQPLCAKEWARKMFKTTTHDFGAVSRGASPSFEFEFTNIYKEDLHVADVRSSCGCTTATITRRGLHSRESAAIVATFNSRAFQGQKNATITVVFDRPYSAEVQLHITGQIREDIAISPSTIEFGQVESGATPESRVLISRAGNSKWRIVDVRSANPHFEVELNEPESIGGLISYEMVVRVKPDMPAGYMQDQLTIVTNENNNLTLPVQGRVVSSLTISPGSLFLGTVPAGQTVTKQLVVRGKSPFRVTHISCGDNSFAFDVTDDAKPLHLIPVKFTPDGRRGRISQTVEISTSSGTATCTVSAMVP